MAEKFKQTRGDVQAIEAFSPYSRKHTQKGNGFTFGAVCILVE